MNLKLSLKFNFEQDFMEKNRKTYATNEIAGTVCCNLVLVVVFHSLHSSTSLPTQEGIYKANYAEFGHTNLENFFTECLVFMWGTLFLM